MKGIRVYALMTVFFVLAMTGSGGAGPVKKGFTNTLAMKFVYIPAGNFIMGAVEIIEDDNTPTHKVTISKGFYLGIQEVTADQWYAVMKQYPDDSRGKLPVANVSWQDVQAFIKKLNELEKTTKYRLPTEAEWEYAARAGTKGDFFFGTEAKKSLDYAWFFSHRGMKKVAHPVGEKKPNAWGLYDIYGNLIEWCQDWYDKGYYKKSPDRDPKGPASGRWRVVRGGSFKEFLRKCCSVYRNAFGETDAFNSIGFRLVKE
jgi:formylglycine-generating enzyme required for sulfatase activity